MGVPHMGSFLLESQISAFKERGCLKGLYLEYDPQQGQLNVWGLTPAYFVPEFWDYSEGLVWVLQ